MGENPQDSMLFLLVVASIAQVVKISFKKKNTVRDFDDWQGLECHGISVVQCRDHKKSVALKGSVLLEVRFGTG